MERHFERSLSEVVETEGKGRISVARRDLKAGECVWLERAYVTAARVGDGALRVCTGCVKGVAANDDSLVGCDACGSIHCTPACRDVDAQHARVCDRWAKLHGDSFSTGRAELFRLMIAFTDTVGQEKAPGAAPTTAAGGDGEQPRATAQDCAGLVGHAEHLPADFVAMIEEHAESLGLSPDLEGMDAVKVAAMLNANAHGDSTNTVFGLFPGLSMFAHSCRPNCAFRISQGVATVRVVDDVPKGTELCITYDAELAMRGRNNRQNALRTARHFDCQCVRCVDEAAHPLHDVFSLCHCANREGKCESYVWCDIDDDSVTEVVCPACSAILDLSVVRQVMETELQVSCQRLALSVRARQLNEGEGLLDATATTALCEEIAASGRRAGLHECHAILAASYRLMMIACVQVQALAVGAKWARRLLACVDAAHAKHAVERANVLKTLASLYAMQARMTTADTTIAPKVKEPLVHRLLTRAAEAGAQLDQQQRICLGADYQKVL